MEIKQCVCLSVHVPYVLQVRGDPRLRRSVRSDSFIPQGSIILPPSLTEDLTSEGQQLASRVQFNFYQKSTVFQVYTFNKHPIQNQICIIVKKKRKCVAFIVFVFYFIFLI